VSRTIQRTAYGQSKNFVLILLGVWQLVPSLAANTPCPLLLCKMLGSWDVKLCGTQNTLELWWLNNKEKDKRKWSWLNLDMWLEGLKNITKPVKKVGVLAEFWTQDILIQIRGCRLLSKTCGGLPSHKIKGTQVKVRRKYSKRERRNEEDGRSLSLNV
jgi:hypothetical protein